MRAKIYIFLCNSYDIDFIFRHETWFYRFTYTSAAICCITTDCYYRVSYFRYRPFLF